MYKESLSLIFPQEIFPISKAEEVEKRGRKAVKQSWQIYREDQWGAQLEVVGRLAVMRGGGWQRKDVKREPN